MNDLTVIFYTCNRIPEPFAARVRVQLLRAIGDTPLISVSHKYMPDFGQNIYVGNHKPTTWRLYQQVLIGALAARTPYVAMAEDDVLYPVGEHFSYRPPLDTFAYDYARWWIEREGFYRWRRRTVLSTCIAPRLLLIETLERLFERFPVEPATRGEMTGMAEPGRYEKYLGLPQVQIEHFTSREPIVTFNLKSSLGGLRKVNETDLIEYELEPWGTATNLWGQYDPLDETRPFDTDPLAQRDVSCANHPEHTC